MKEKTNQHDGSRSPDFRVSQITPKDIREQLDRVLSSPDPQASQKVETIFRYLTEETSSL